MHINVDKKVTQFIQQQDLSSKSKIARAFDLLETHSYLIGMPYSKKVSKDLFELRIMGKIQIRFLYCFWKNEIFILHSFHKKTNQIPIKDLRYAVTKFRNLTDITNKL